MPLSKRLASQLIGEARHFSAMAVHESDVIEKQFWRSLRNKALRAARMYYNGAAY